MNYLESNQENPKSKRRHRQKQGQTLEIEQRRTKRLVYWENAAKSKQNESSEKHDFRQRFEQIHTKREI